MLLVWDMLESPWQYYSQTSNTRCEEANEKVKFLYGKVLRKELQVTDTLNAELTKCIENAYRDVNIAFANETALICEDFDRNIFEIIELINHRHDRMMHYLVSIKSNFALYYEIF